MAEIKVPEYKNLTKLPSGSTISLWENKSVIHNVETMFPSTMLMPKDDNLTWETAIDPTKEWWFTAVTKAEWDNKIVNPETMMVDKIPGGLRVDNGWEQLIFQPTTEEAVNVLAYHMSSFHTKVTTDVVVIAIQFDGYNLCFHHGQKKTNCFQRGQSVQFLQVLNPFFYKLTDNEKNNMRAMHVKYDPTERFEIYNWKSQWVWLYGHPLHLPTMVDLALADDNFIHNTILCQALQHLGQFGTSMMEPEVQVKTAQFRTKMGLDTIYVDRPEESQRGHPLHAQWIKDNSLWGEEDKEKDKDNEIENVNKDDDAMEGPKKRKVQ